MVKTITKAGKRIKEINYFHISKNYDILLLSSLINLFYRTSECMDY